MAYQPLARTYRPSRFRELVGQDAVALALSNAIVTGRTLANLIFTGVRGVGKTTVARLYAKALNCEARTEGSAEPCNACESCRAIAGGHHEDVLEIDGASNTGVADVRALQEEIEYAPKRSHYKVYIIDEVHMLSGAAFNALLKTLEERRPHVIFVFATTELQKVPETILSRCPTFHLKKLSIDLISRQMRMILDKEGIEAEDKAIAVIAREGHGSMRDALTLLDQAIALGAGKVSVAALGPMVSNLSSSPYLDLLQALVRRDADAALATIAAFDESGAEFPSVVEELAGFARHAFVVKDLGLKALDTALLGLDDGELGRLTEAAQLAQPFDLNRIFRTLVKCRGELSGEALDRFIVENYVFEWCLDPGLPDLDTLMGGLGSGGDAKPVPSARSAPVSLRNAATTPRAEAASASAGPATTASVVTPVAIVGEPTPSDPVVNVPPAASPAQRLAAAREAVSGGNRAGSKPVARPVAATLASQPPATASLRVASSQSSPAARSSVQTAAAPSTPQTQASVAESAAAPAPPATAVPAQAPVLPSTTSPAPSPAQVPQASPAPSPAQVPQTSPTPSPAQVPQTSPTPSPGQAPRSSPTPSPSQTVRPSVAPVSVATQSPRPATVSAPQALSPAPRAGAQSMPFNGSDFDDIPDLADDAVFQEVSKPTPVMPRESPRFPASWRDLVEGWKHGKPLQARKLEEAHPIEYSAARIVLVVAEDSFASKSLLKPDEQARVREQFRELFGFTGSLIVSARGQSHGATAAALPDTLLDTRSKEADERRQKLLDDARNAPFTKEVLAVLGGTIEDIRTL